MEGSSPDHVAADRHRWFIEEREILRHEARRGRRHAFEHLDPRRTALVVIDMVRFFVEASPFAIGIVAPINASADLVRSAGGVVAWVVPDPPPPGVADIEFYGETVAAAYHESGGSGPLPERLWPDLAVATEDLVLAKSAPSAFFPGRCGLHEQLAHQGIENVILAGTVANVCCESSARDAKTLGYRVVMLADGIAAPTDEMLNATFRTIYRSFGDVRSSDDLPHLLAPSRPVDSTSSGDVADSPSQADEGAP